MHYSPKVAFTLLAVMSSMSSAMVLKREPSDKSGNSKMSLDCTALTLPYPGGANGEAEGGSSYFTNSLTYTDNTGAELTVNCPEPDGYCSSCTVSGGALAGDVAVQACDNPLGGNDGCQITFDYKGTHYDSNDSQPQCGHEGGGFQAFSSDVQAVCYFNI